MTSAGILHGRALLRVLPLALPLGLLVATGLRGIDFGFHWDEGYHVETVRTALERGAPLPGAYRYPAASFWLALASALPDAWATRATSDPEARRARRDARLDGKAYLLRTRALFLVATALSLVPVYALVLGWRRRVGEALLAASVLGLSWELAYHARWIAPDGLLVLFGAATLLWSVRTLRAPASRAAPWLAAVSAGLGLATKWPAGLLVVPVLLAAWLTGAAAGRSVRARTLQIFALGAVAGGVYLVVTPGTLLEIDALRESLAMQQSVYSRGHLGHGVAPGGAHLLRVGEYLGLAFASPWPPVAAVFAGFAVVGVALLVRESRAQAAVVLAFPVLYLGFFAAYSTVIARNYLVLAPFFAVLAARGIFACADRLRGRPARTGLLGLAGLALAANALWLVTAAESIRGRREAPIVEQLAGYLAARPGTRFALSPHVRRELDARGLDPGPHARARPADADAVVVHASDAYLRILGCRPSVDLTDVWFGPYEVNFNYYPSWLGSDRIVVMPTSHLPLRPALSPELAPPDLRPGALTEGGS